MYVHDALTLNILTITRTNNNIYLIISGQWWRFIKHCQKHEIAEF